MSLDGAYMIIHLAALIQFAEKIIILCILFVGTKFWKYQLKQLWNTNVSASNLNPEYKASKVINGSFKIFDLIKSEQYQDEKFIFQVLV